MLPSLADLRAHVRPMLRLAVPVVIAELGWMSMGVVDTLMVGRLGPDAIGAVGVGSIVFFSIGVFGLGLLLGLDTLVSQAYGAGRLDECHRCLVDGVTLAVLVALPMMALVGVGAAVLPRVGLHPDVQGPTIAYLHALNWGLLPLLVYGAFRRYLQGLHHVRPITWALVTANAVNAGFNWLLIGGHLGAPALGVRGSAWSTVIALTYLTVFLGLAVVRRNRGPRPSVWHAPASNWSRLQRLLTLGGPAAGQLTLEVGVFGVATVLAGTLDPVALAAHQIALNIASVTFMIPLGMASAGAVMVGHGVGRGDPGEAIRSGWTALALTASFAACVMIVYVALPGPLLRLFSDDPSVVSTGVPLLLIAAAFQLFDGTQCVATGVLRGLGDTRTPMWWNIAGHWAIGLPLAYVLCFRTGLGVTGLWMGLSSGLMIIGVVLLGVWARKANALVAGQRRS